MYFFECASLGGRTWPSRYTGVMAGDGKVAVRKKGGKTERKLLNSFHKGKRQKSRGGKIQKGHTFNSVFICAVLVVLVEFYMKHVEVCRIHKDYAAFFHVIRSSLGSSYESIYSRIDKGALET